MVKNVQRPKIRTCHYVMTLRINIPSTINLFKIYLTRIILFFNNLICSKIWHRYLTCVPFLQFL